VSNLFVGHEPKDGQDCVYVGVYVLKWQSHWGSPDIIFNRLSDEDEVTEFFANLEHDQQMLILEMALQSMRDEIADGFMAESGILSEIAPEFIETTYETINKFMEVDHE